MGRLKKYNSLKKNSEFSLIYKETNKWHTESAVIFYKTTNEKKVGFTASKKVGNAVKRNLARRRLRAIFLELQDELNDGTYVFVAKEPIHKFDYKTLKSSLLWSFKRLGCIRN